MHFKNFLCLKSAACSDLSLIERDIINEIARLKADRNAKVFELSGLRARKSERAEERRRLRNEFAVGSIGPSVPRAITRSLSMLRGQTATELSQVDADIRQLEQQIEIVELELAKFNDDQIRINQSLSQNSDEMLRLGCRN